MKIHQKASYLFLAMTAASLAVAWARPDPKARPAAASFSLAQTVPRQFGSWREQENRVAEVVNPQTQELLDRLYSQILTRVYVDPEGHRMMLSVAYGGDQRGEMQAHKPEVCYPSQGFNIISDSEGRIATDFGEIPVRRLLATMDRRHEPLTYWFTMADTAVQSAFEKKLVLVRFRLTGQVPDGLLFRVSSIDPDAAQGWSLQEQFVRDLMRAVPAGARLRLAGLTG